MKYASTSYNPRLSITAKRCRIMYLGTNSSTYFKLKVYETCCQKKKYISSGVKNTPHLGMFPINIVDTPPPTFGGPLGGTFIQYF